MQPTTPSELNRKLDQLSRDLKRQKRVNLALFIAALLALGATQVVSQTQIKSMAVTTLQIVDDKGRVKAFLSADPSVNKSGATLAILDERGAVRAQIAYDGKNSLASFMGATKQGARKGGEPMAMIGYCDDAGMLTLANQNSANSATLVAGKELAGAVFTNPSGKDGFLVEVDKNGGLVKLFDASGKERPLATPAPNTKGEAVKIEGAALRKSN